MSTLLFKHSLRESAAPIKGICMNDADGKIMTHDDYATRLWIKTKQVKSLRMNHPKEVKFVRMVSIPAIDRVLLFFTVLRSSEEKGGYIQLMTWNLEPVDQIKLDLHSIVKMSVSPSLTELIFIDKYSKFTAMHLKFVLKDEDDESEVELSFAQITHNTYHPKPIRQATRIELCTTQTIEYIDSSIRDCLLVNDHTIGFVNDHSLYVFTRPSLLYVPPPVVAVDNSMALSSAGVGGKPKWVSKKEKQALLELKLAEEAEAKAKAALEPQKIFSDYTNLGAILLQPPVQFYNRLPNILRLGGSDKIIVGYNNGSIQVVSSEALRYPRVVRRAGSKPGSSSNSSSNSSSSSSNQSNDSESTRKDSLYATLICEFQAHYVPEAVLNTIRYNAAEAKTTMDEDLVGYNNSNNNNNHPTMSAPIGTPSHGLLTATICPWNASSGPVGLGYQFEFLTIGCDRRIAHWGIRFAGGQSKMHQTTHHQINVEINISHDDDHITLGSNNNNNNSTTQSVSVSTETDHVMSADLLGEYQLPIEAPTHLSAKTSSVSNSMLYSSIVAYELSMKRHPISKNLMCIAGGMIAFFEILQPYRVVMGAVSNPSNQIATLGLGVGLGAVTKRIRAGRNDVSSIDMDQQYIVSSCKGPDLCLLQSSLATAGFVNIESFLNENDSYQSQGTIIVLKHRSVDIVLVQSGRVLQSYPTSNLQELSHLESSPLPLLHAGDGDKTAAVGMGRLGHRPVTATSALLKDSIQYQKDNARFEGKPCVVYYCAITNLILVGFKSGGVGVIGLTGLIQSPLSSIPFAHLDSTTAHDEISVMMTCRHRLQRNADAAFPPPPEDIVVALLGDINGVLSLWQLSPPPLKKGASAFLSSSQTHQGRIVYAHSCVLDESLSHRIIVTCCSMGAVKAWKLEARGDLTITAFFHAQLDGMMKVTAALAVPVITHEYVEPAGNALDDDYSDSEDEEDSDDDDEFLSSEGEGGSSEEGESSEPSRVLAGVYHEIFCVVGYNNGLIKCWRLSNNKSNASAVRLTKYQDKASAINTFIRPPSFLGLQTTLQNPSESLFTPFDNDFSLIAVHDDGLCVALKFKIDELQFQRVRYFTLPTPVSNAIFITKSVESFIKKDAPHDVLVHQQQHQNDLSKTAAMIMSTYADALINQSMECVLVGDFVVYHTLPICQSHIPTIWQRHPQTSSLVHWQINHGTVGSSRYYDQTLALTTYYHRSHGTTAAGRGRSIHMPTPVMPAVEVLLPFEEKDDFTAADTNKLTMSSDTIVYSDEDEQSGDSSTISTLQPMSFDDEKSIDQLAAPSYVGSMEKMDRILSTDIYFAKKDRRLLELFTHYNVSSDNTVSLATAAHIVCTWLNVDAVNKDHIWELFSLLEINENDRLKFAEVAKIAAVVTVATEWNQTKKKLSGSVGQIPAYSKLKSYTSKVTYNSMGERSITKVYFSKHSHEGIWNGVASKIRELWNSQDCRVLKQIDVIKAIPSNVILTELPSKYTALIPRSIPLPKNWSTDNIHWFHPLRVIRIARTLLDIRSVKQHELFHHQTATSRDPIISSNTTNTYCSSTMMGMMESMAEITVKYFEQNYGDKSKVMDVSRHKVVHFLEACCQYKEHPIVNILHRMLELGKGYDAPPTDTAAWLCVEARSVLSSKGCVISGDLVQPFAAIQVQAPNIQSGAALQVRWQYVAKADAHWCIDEMLRVRGRYGPLVYEGMQNLIDAIPVTESYTSPDGLVHKVNATTAPLIDFEKFLEMLYCEFLNNEKIVKDREVEAFGEHSMQAGRSTAPRDISRKPKHKILILDDQPTKFGAFHEANLTKIKDWIVEFLQYDPLRTGTVSQEVFTECVVKKHNFFGSGGWSSSSSSTDLVEYIQICIDRFVQGEPDANISYIDMFGQLLAWESQVQGERDFILRDLIKSLPFIKRTIEKSYASLVIEYFERVSCHPNADPIWTMGHRTDEARDPTKKKPPGGGGLSIAMDGNWNLNTAVPDDKPGLLKIQKEPIHSSLAVGVPMGEVTAKRQKTRLSTEVIPTAPYVLPSLRSRTNLFGETSQPLRMTTQAPLTIKNMTAAAVASDQFSIVSSSLLTEMRNDSLSRGSYSRAMSRASAVDSPEDYDEMTHASKPTSQPTSTTSLQSDPNNNNNYNNNFELELASSEDLYFTAPNPKSTEELQRSLQDSKVEGSFILSGDQDFASLAEPYFIIHERLRKSKSNSSFDLQDDDDKHAIIIDSDYQSYSINGGGGGGGGDESIMSSSSSSLLDYIAFTGMQKKIAADEVARLKKQYQSRMEEWDDELRREAERFQERTKLKFNIRKQVRQQMKEKERVSMQVYYKTVDDKFKSNQEAKEKLDAINKQIEMDKHAKEDEIQRLRELNNTKSLQKQKEKEAKALAEREKAMADKELKLMRKEELMMIKYNAKLESDRQKELALQKKAEDEAFRKRMEESMALLLEADAAVHTPSSSEVVAEPVSVEEEVPPSEEKEENDEKDGDDEKDDDEDDGEEEDGEEEESGAVDSLTDEPREEQSQEEGELRVGEGSVTDTIVEEQEQQQQQEEEEKEEEDEGETSTLQRRMTRFLNNVKASKISHTTHTRQDPKNTHTFFMPLMFSDDIYFNPFETSVDNNNNNHDEWLLSDGQGEACVEGEAASRSNSIIDVSEEKQHDRHLMHLLRSFDDVNSKLKENSLTMEKQRSLLFSTTTDDINPDEWTQLFRTYNINWKAFFESEETSKNLSKFVKDAMKEYQNNFSQKDPLLARSLTKVKPFKSKAYLSTHGESIDRSNDSNDNDDDNENENYHTQNDNELFEDAKKKEEEEEEGHNRTFVIPSPSSTVCSPTKISTIAVNQDHLLSEKVLQGSYKYYKIDHRRSDQTRRCNNNYQGNNSNNNNKQKYLVTIEVDCLVGLVDFFLSFRKVPCVSDFERHVTCTAKKDGKATLTFQPNPWKDGCYFIAVFSYYTDALFNIRAITTHDNDAIRPNPVLKRVDKILRKLEILAATDGAALQENYAKLEAEAKKMVNDDDKQYKLSAKTRTADQLMLLQSEASVYTSNSSSFVDNYDDTHSIGKFMVKIARYVLPPTEDPDGSKASQGDDDDDDDDDGALDIAGQTDLEEGGGGGHAYSQVEAAATDDWQDDDDDVRDVHGAHHLSTVEESSDEAAANQSASYDDRSGPSMLMYNPSTALGHIPPSDHHSGANTAFIEVDTLRFSSSMPILNMFGQAVTVAHSPPLQPAMTNNSKYLAMTTDQFDVSSSEHQLDLRKSKSLIDIAKDYAQRERKFRSDNASITIPIKGESVPLFEASEKHRHRIKDPLLTQVIKPLKYSITRDYA